MCRNLILGSAGVVIGVIAEWIGSGWRDLGYWLPDLAVGWMFIGCGLVASAKRTESRCGALMSATGFTWFLGNFAAISSGAVAWVAAHAMYLHRGPLVHLMLTYPNGRSPSRLTRAAIAMGYVAAVLTAVWWSGPGTVLLAACLLGVCAGEYLRAVGRTRRARSFALPAAVGLSLVLVGTVVARQVLPPGGVGPASLLVYEATLMVIAAQLLAGLLLAPWQRVPVADLVVQLGESRSWTLRGELARVLGDPTLEVGYWVADTGMYVDSAGRMISLPDPGSQRSATTIERDGQPVAVLIHTAAMLDDPELLEAITAAARLGARNARLQVQVQARIAELDVSRRRILQAGDTARRRLEGRLADGAERRLAEMAQTLRRAGLGARGEQTRQAITHAAEQLTRTLEELRRLALGLHPRALSEHGLRAALAVLAGDASLPVELEISLEISGGRLAPQIEATAYFVCSEGLANVAKHAFASRAVIRVTRQNGRVRVVVDDDGIGGADPGRGSGLRGLADRVETLAGTLRVRSPPGGGTRLVAEIPIGGQPS